MSVTIQEVAEAAGVSKATVSKVLHKSYSISQETCDRVNAVIKELGYQPNRRAQSFATGATKTILFLAEMQHGVGFDNPHLFEIMAGVENALSEKGYGLIVQHSTALDLWQNFDELLQGSYVDGVILHASVVSKDVALCLAHTELPYIVVGAPDFSNQLCWIDTNNSVAGQIAVTHLWRNGYDRIAFIGGPKEDTISAHRLSGALATLNEKIPAGYLREGPPTSEGGAAAARALLELPTRPNAVICANQYIAFGCVNELKASGIRIPEDMAVITFDDFPFSKIIEPQLSVVNLDMYDMGEQAAKVVLRRIRTPQYLVLFHKYFYFFFTFFRSCLSDIYIFHSLARSASSSPEQQRGVRVQQPGQRVIHGIGIAALSQALGAQLVEGCFCQPILCRRHRQLAACGQIVHPQDEPSRFFGTAAAGALAVVDIAQRPEQDAFVGTVEFNFTFQFFLQCQLYIGKRLRFALKAIQLKKFQK